ncbi:MAG: hypothetical protein WC512_01540 [Candidatus Omnitrophota bacterium]
MSKDRRPLLYAAAIVILGIMAYRGSLFGKFLLDDLTLVVFNPHIRDLSGAAGLFSENIGAGMGPDVSSSFYRPFQMLTYALDLRVWGLSYIGCHFTNLLLHISAALGLYYFVRMVSGRSLLAFLSGALFAVHPVNTEAVSYISGRADPLSAAFILLCLISYVKYLDTNKVVYYALFPLCYIIAVFSRESALLVIPLVLLYHYSFRRRISAAGLAPLVAVTGLYLIARACALKSMLPHFIAPGPVMGRIAAFFAAFAEYIRILFFPYGLHMEYGRKAFGFGDPLTLSGLALFAVCVFFILKKRASRGLDLFCAGWFIIALLPVSNIFPLNAYMAEHWLYLPSAGFFVLVSSALLYIYRIERTRLAAVALAVVVLGSYTMATIKQNRYWSEPEFFYKKTLEYSPGSARMYTYLAVHYLMQNRQHDAETMFRKAEEIKRVSY